MKSNRIFILLGVLLLFLSVCSPSIAQKSTEKISRLGEYKGYTPKKYNNFKYSSYYVPMPDSVRLAVDLYLPKGLKPETKVPALVYFVRYGRSLELKNFFKFISDPFMGHVHKDEIQFFSSHGYACIVVDLRGSGASFGRRSMEFSPKEVEDMRYILDWIVAQSWSNGKTATTGVSYTGTTAELALSTRHPSLKASVPRCGIYDLYEDMTLPGGIRQAPFIEIWKKTTVALDNNNLAVFGGLAKALVKGIKPVQGDKKRTLLRQAVEEHKENFDIFAGLFRVEARDDIDPINGLSCDAYSIHRRIPEIEASAVPIYRITGWYDGANIGGVVKAYWNIKNTKRVLIGPWDHGPAEYISPFGARNNKKARKVKFNVYAEMLRFLDHHVMGIENGIDKEAPFVYYQMGEELFKEVQEWPLKEAKQQTLFLTNNNGLSPTAPAEAMLCSKYRCDYNLGTGNTTRWNSLTPLFRGGPIAYNQRKERNERMLVFTGSPADTDMEISGHPIADLYLSSNADDANIFIYIEELSPSGQVTYITEGYFRAAHRKVIEDAPLRTAGPFHSYKREDMQLMQPGEVVRVQFDLQPISYLLRKGHAIRVSIAASDIDHFEIPAKNAAEELTIHHSLQHPSKVELSVIKK